MYDSLNCLEPVPESIPVELVSLMLTATANIAHYTGLVEHFPHSDLLGKLRYLLNYKYSRFNADIQTGGIKIITDDYARFQFLKSKHHFHFSYALEFLQEALPQNEKLPMFQLLRFSRFLNFQNPGALESETTQDENTKDYVRTLWKMLSKVYVCDEKPVMLKLVDFWTEQRFYNYSFDMQPLNFEVFELLLNQEILGTISCHAGTIYLNKSVLQSNLRYITEPDKYRVELLKILCNSFSEVEHLVKNIEQCANQLFQHIAEEFGDTKANNIRGLLMAEPIITNSNAEAFLHVSRKTAIGCLKQLEKIKLLRLLQIKNKVYYLNLKLIEIMDQY